MKEHSLALKLIQVLANYPRHKWLFRISLSFFVLISITLLVTDPVLQNPSYHVLADTRPWLFTPNFADVISNLPFALVGLAGLLYCLRKNTHTSLSWQVYFIGLILVAAGSGYYHWNPNNQTLVWDRLPMTICFMSLFSALLVDNVSQQLEKPLLPASLLIGASSVIYWHYTGDLRFYAAIQFGTLAAIPLILYLYKSQYTHRNYLLYGLVFYVLAKILELNDSQIFELSVGVISGHTAKHLFAAAATYCIYLMLKKRRPIEYD